MPELQRTIMQKLYGHDIWEQFRPVTSADEVQGWNGNHPSLRRLAGSTGGAIVIDVGVWKGQSTITMARAMKDAGIDGCVIAVDTFLGSAEHWDPGRNLFTRHHGLPDIYGTFLANVHAAGVTGYVVPIPQTSANAAMILRLIVHHRIGHPHRCCARIRSRAERRAGLLEHSRTRRLPDRR
jgi:hypothetical protein